MRDLKKHVEEMKNVGGGESGISTRVFRDIVDIAADSVRHYQHVARLWCVAEKWKCSTVVPVPKVSRSNICSEFRPINIVPVYEKILEIVVKAQIEEYCNSNNIIVGNQSGFRQGHSCETVIVNICDEFRKAIDRNCYVLAVFLDFRRALIYLSDLMIV